MSAKPKSILVVDDEPHITSMLKSALIRKGYEVAVAGDGTEGLAMFRGHGCFDLVLTDVVMPGLSGPEMVSEIAKACPNVKAIFITGYTNAVISDRLGGCPDRLFHKPFQIPKLLAAIQKCLALA
jgi:two-component system cell cycle sensor histidine kinase/response regulator CckA